MDEQIRVTAAAKKKVEDELAYLEGPASSQVAEELKEAMAQGDLSENAEYESAKEKKANIDHEIEQKKDLLKKMVVVDISELNVDEVDLGSTVTLFIPAMNREMVLTIVGSTETNSREGKISLDSPVGKEIYKKKTGDVVYVRDLEYKIVKVERF